MDQGRGGGEADRQPLLTRRQAEPQCEMISYRLPSPF
jgi:hypothetical protein